MDSATDTATSTVTYNVVAPADLAILKLAPLLVRAGGTITYTIGVGNLGGSNAVDVVVSDTLPADTTLVSASGNNVSCSVVNRRLTCSTTPITCTGTSAVSCSADCDRTVVFVVTERRDPENHGAAGECMDRRDDRQRIPPR